MRQTIPIAAMFLVVVAMAASAFAQAWSGYSYPEMGFAVQFPDVPKVETVSYRTAAGSMAPTTVYSVQEGKSTFKVTVADFSNLAGEQKDALDRAVKAVQDTGEVKLDVGSRISREYGHELSVADKDGSHSTMALFFVGTKLYVLEAKVLPPNPQAGSGDAIRFQQSLQFIGGGGRGFGGFGRRNPSGQ